MTFVWRAEDDNGDELSYDMFYRREGETSWKLLKRGMSDQILVWDTTSVPNGRYTVRIVAADTPSNSTSSCALGRAREHRLRDRQRSAGRSRSCQSGETMAERPSPSTSAMRIRPCRRSSSRSMGTSGSPVYPKDGIADSRFEQFEFVLEGDAVSRGVTLRATDALNNTASARGETTEPASGRR